MSELTDREVVEKAQRYVAELCEGKRRWSMSIPARPDEDVDLVIGRALNIAETAVGTGDDYCETCDDERRIPNDVDGTGPYKPCPDCNPAGPVSQEGGFITITLGEAQEEAE